MTTTQSFKIYEVLQRHFKNNDDAKIVVQEIEQIIEIKIENKSTVLFTKEDGAALKEEILNLRIDMKKRFYNNINWTFGSVLTGVGLLFTMIKIFLIK